MTYTIINWNNMKVSECQTFLEVDTLKFMAVDSTENCTDCYFLTPEEYCDCVYWACDTHERKDNRTIVWMRIL